MAKKNIVTIDGPAGAGKSTVGILLAERLGYDYLDTGALYRAVAFRVSKRGISEAGEEPIARLASNLSIRVSRSSGEARVTEAGEDITDGIRSPEIGMLASKISAYPLVRKALLSIQRELGEKGGIVADGRDMGTVIFPDAAFKFYLDADPNERSKRRYLELKGKSREVRLSDVQQDMIMRDKQDTERKAAPLKPAADASVINSTHMSIREVIETMLAIIQKGKPQQGEGSNP